MIRFVARIFLSLLSLKGVISIHEFLVLDCSINYCGEEKTWQIFTKIFLQNFQNILSQIPCFSIYEFVQKTSNQKIKIMDEVVKFQIFNYRWKYDNGQLYPKFPKIWLLCGRIDLYSGYTIQCIECYIWNNVACKLLGWSSDSCILMKKNLLPTFIVSATKVHVAMVIGVDYTKPFIHDGL